MLLGVPECSHGGAFERHKFRNWHERLSVNTESGVRGRSAEEPIRDMECAHSCFAVHRFWLRNGFRLLSDIGTCTVAPFTLQGACDVFG